MKTTTKDAIISTLKEAGRIAIFAAIAALVNWGYTQVAAMPADGAITMILTVVLRLADKFVHKNDAIKANGLVPF